MVEGRLEERVGEGGGAVIVLRQHIAHVKFSPHFSKHEGRVGREGEEGVFTAGGEPAQLA